MDSSLPNSIRLRAVTHRRFARRSVVGLVALSLFVLLFFVLALAPVAWRPADDGIHWSDTVVSTERRDPSALESLRRENSELRSGVDTAVVRSLRRQVAEQAASIARLENQADERHSPRVRELSAQVESLQRNNDSLERRADSQQFLLASIGMIVLRFGAVVLSLFVVQVLSSFSRYHFRVADHLFASADALECASSDARLLASAVAALTPAHIDFSRPPKPVYERAVDAAAAVASKVKAVPE